MTEPFRYCPFCAEPLITRTVGDRSRPTCPKCDFVHWRNPVTGVAVIVLSGDDCILLGQRARGVYAGDWCIPCGYVEHGERVREAAEREFLEETGLVVRTGEVYAVHSNFHNPKLNSVGLWFRAEVIGGELEARDDLSAVGWFSLLDLPERLAFPTDIEVLEQLRRELHPVV